MERCTEQWYGKDPGVANVFEKVPVLISPESQLPSGAQPGEQEPEVVEWNPWDQTQLTLSPALIVVVEFPLTASVKTVLVRVTVRVAAWAAEARSATARTASERTVRRKDRMTGRGIGVSLVVRATMRA
jgi:hypothetical protein